MTTKIECLNCHKSNSVNEYKFSDVTGWRVCPRCGYEGGKLSPADPGDHQDEWNSLFSDKGFPSSDDEDE